MKLDHTLTEAFKKFELINGAGDGEQTACAMTLLSWVCGEEWSDHPPCAHRLIANAVIRANDATHTTPEMRRELVKAGVKGVLDTWWVPAEVIAVAIARTKEEVKEKPTESHFEAAMRLLTRIAEWKKTKTQPVLRGADLSGADLSGAVLRGAVLSDAVLRDADLSGADLSGAVLRGADLSGADLSGAVLRGAVLRGADLSGADLSGADLSGADGQPWSGMPDGWTLNENGLWMRS
jgi:hypothetical protein